MKLNVGRGCSWERFATNGPSINADTGEDGAVLRGDRSKGGIKPKRRGGGKGEGGGGYRCRGPSCAMVRMSGRKWGTLKKKRRKTGIKKGG